MSEVVKSVNLPAINELKNNLKVLAILDIIMLSDEDAWLRLHQWMEYPEKLLSVGVVNNGAGDSLFVIFSRWGCIVKGFDHESFFTPYARDEFKVWPGIYDEVPENLLLLLNDVSFEKEDVTFCIWRENHDGGWKKGSICNPDGNDDGTAFLLGYIEHNASGYRQWAQNYYDMRLPLAVIEQIFNGCLITGDMIKALNPKRNTEEALKELSYIKREE